MKDNNTLAFPTSFRPDFPNEIGGGMTLRDYFAAKALQGYCSDPVLLGALGRGSVKPEQVAGRAYEMADAMMEARK